MSGVTCCGMLPDAPPLAAHSARRAHVLGMLLPGAVLALLPKCPMCLAAYLTVITSVSVSPAEAETVRTAIMALCGLSFCYLAVRAARAWRTPS
ncbi:MAG: hypothetical protein SFV19_17150 [Rhodospirillaceae bacterium]|nr:hypothetical protein [Rhodospirillaceae bacterium]